MRLGATSCVRCLTRRRTATGSRSAGALIDTLRRLSPDVVVLHDPFWRPAGVTREAHSLGARVIAVHHASAALNAAGLPGPAPVYLPLLKRIYRHAYQDVDAVMSVVDPSPDSGRKCDDSASLRSSPRFSPCPGRRAGATCSMWAG